jgi:hypothetical protein
MYKRKSRTILIMIIPMLVVEPKLPENVLASEVSLAIYIALFSVFLVNLVCLVLLKHSFHFCLKSKVGSRILL